MKYKKIMLFAGTLLPISVLLRVAQLMFTVEKTTGFFKPEYEVYGYAILILMFVFAAAAALLAFTTHRSPEYPPMGNIYMGATSLALAFFILREALSATVSPTSMPWQVTLLKITGLAAAIFFAASGVGNVISFKIPSLCYALPLLYFVFKTIYEFTAISALALISDNIILLGAYCSVMWFMLQYAKLYNSAQSDSDFRKLLSSAILSVIFCLTQSLPQIIVNIITGNSYLHISSATNWAMLFTGIFIAVFTVFHFSHRNACE